MLMEKDWSVAPYEDFPDQIANKLPCIRDFLRFCLVCNSWRSLLTVQRNYLLQSDHNQPPFSKGIPCLMLTQTSSDDNATRGFYNLLTNNRYNLSLPEAQGRRCWGTPYGWLITIGLDLEMHLLNPLTRARIQLPGQRTFKHQYDGCYRGREEKRTFYVKKAILGLDGDQYIVMALHTEIFKLAFARPGDKAWTTIQDTPIGGFKDFTCVKGQFYAINTTGEIYVCDLSDPFHPKATYIAPAKNEDTTKYNGFYLLEMAGELHMVVRYYEINLMVHMPYKCNRYATYLFQAYKVDLCTKELIELESLDGHTIFLGNNTSFSISSSDHPEFKGNSIYFTDDSYQGYDTGRDMGIFDYKEDTIIPLYIGQDCICRFLPPTVFTPNW